MNVLDADRTPKVMGLGEVLRHWLRHQIEVLVRKAQHRLEKIDARLELLQGYIIAFLNLDRIIEIIRTEDEPKPVMMAEFQLNDRQAEAILTMRLRTLRRLEEMELRRDLEALEAEREELVKLIESPALQKKRLKKDLSALRKNYAEETALGRRRTSLEEAGQAREISLEAFVEREPVTVIMSKRGWIKAMKGHADLAVREITKFKEGDGTLLDNVLIFANSDTGYARQHTLDGMPAFLAGRAGGRVPRRPLPRSWRKARQGRTRAARG